MPRRKIHQIFIKIYAFAYAETRWTLATSHFKRPCFGQHILNENVNKIASDVRWVRSDDQNMAAYNCPLALSSVIFTQGEFFCQFIPKKSIFIECQELSVEFY